MHELKRPASRIEPDSLMRGSEVVEVEAALRMLNRNEGGMLYGYPYYYMRGIPGAAPRVTVTYDMMSRLEEATGRSGLDICVLDGIRTRATQEHLHAAHPESAALGYVSEPGSSAHEVGRAVDLVLMHQGSPLLLGTGYDHFGPEAHPDHHHPEPVMLAREELCRMMLEVGLKVHQREWWHFEL